MSNLANYSPYNKTYKFILFQNQAYHEKAKRDMIPVVRTNLKYKRSASLVGTGRSSKVFSDFETGLNNPEYSGSVLKVLMMIF